METPHIKVLKALSEQGYLTPKQMVEYGIRTDTSNVNKILREMKGKKNSLIQEIDLGRDPAYGKFEHIYYLTRQGVQACQDVLEIEESKIKAPKKKTPYYKQDFEHRKKTIDFHLQMSKWAKINGVKIPLCEYYFEKEDKGSTAKVKTHIKINDDISIVPDAIYKIENDDKEVLYIFEQHQGESVERFFNQAKFIIMAINEGIPRKKYGTDKGGKICCVFENESTMRSSMKKLNSEEKYKTFAKAFIFKTSDQVKEDFGNGWHLFTGQTVDFFGNPQD